MVEPITYITPLILKLPLNKILSCFPSREPKIILYTYPTPIKGKF